MSEAGWTEAVDCVCNHPGCDPDYGHFGPCIGEWLCPRCLKLHHQRPERCDSCAVLGYLDADG